MMTTDGFTVQPLVFPGGSLGSLAAHGVLNDLAVAGALPRWLTLGAILEEGLEVSLLQQLVGDFARAVQEADAVVVAGDTKVVPRGHGGGAYFTVAGLGEQTRAGLGFEAIQPGDVVVVSGTVGDHGTAVMLAREEFALRGEILSDCGSVLSLCQTAYAYQSLRFMRDPTRGGLATVMHEIHQATGLGSHLVATQIPIAQETKGVCEILGFDPLYLACEGRVVAVIGRDEAQDLVQNWQSMQEGQDAAIVGRISHDVDGVVLETEVGGLRILEELEDDPLPRIC
jgi:hydrogenase expression/formation protein HypE